MEKGEHDLVPHFCSRAPIVSDEILINECVKNDFDIIGEPVHAKNETSSTPQNKRTPTCIGFKEGLEFLTTMVICSSNLVFTVRLGL